MFFIITLLLSLNPAPQPPKGGVLKESLQTQDKAKIQVNQLKLLGKLRAQDFPKYNEIKLLNNKNLLLFFKSNKTDDTQRKILSIIKQRNFTKSELNIKKLSLSKKIDLVKNLNKKSILIIKYHPIFFTALSYLKDNVFSTEDESYLLNILTNAIKQNNSFIIKKVFSIPQILKVKLFEEILSSKNIENKSKNFFMSSLTELNLDIKNKLEFKEHSSKDIYLFKNDVLEKNLLYSIPKFFTIGEEESLKIYNKIAKKNRIYFINSLTLNQVNIPLILLKKIKLNNKELFLTILKYSDKNNKKIQLVSKFIKNKSLCTKDINSNCITSKSLAYLNLYINKKLFNDIKKNEKLFLEYLKITVENNKKNLFLDKYSKKTYKNLKLNLYIRVLLTKYIINNKLLKNSDIFKYILSLFDNKKIEYKSDEHYISVILPILANNYKKADFKFYKKLLKMLNKTSMEASLEAIKISGDKSFIKLLKPLLKEKEIQYFVKKTIWSLEN